MSGEAANRCDATVVCDRKKRLVKDLPESRIVVRFDYCLDAGYADIATLSLRGRIHQKGKRLAHARGMNADSEYVEAREHVKPLAPSLTLARSAPLIKQMPSLTPGISSSSG